MRKHIKFLMDQIKTTAKLLMFSGKISPKIANKTGPTPRPYASPVQITLIGKIISLALFHVELAENWKYFEIL